MARPLGFRLTDEQKEKIAKARQAKSEQLVWLLEERTRLLEENEQLKNPPKTPISETFLTLLTEVLESEPGQRLLSVIMRTRPPALIVAPKSVPPSEPPPAPKVRMAKVLVVYTTLPAGQAQALKARYESTLKLDFATDVREVARKAPGADHVILMTDHMGHKHEETAFQHSGLTAKVRRVSGNVRNLKAELATL